MKSRCLILFLAMVALAGSVPAQQAERSGQDGTIRIDTSLVMVDGIVLDKRTRSVVGDLKREDFTILENDTPREITHFSREELPLSVVLLLDVSGSVQPIIEEVRAAALKALGNLKPQDSVATMIFGNRTKLITQLTSNRQVIRDGLDDMWSSTLEVGSGTVITHAVYSASRYLKQQTRPMDRRAIILITDDEDFRYSVPPREVVLRELHDSGSALCGIIVSHGKAARTAVSVGTTAAITAVNPILGGVLIGMKIFRKASSPGSTSRYFTENTGGVLVGAKKEEVGRVFIELMQLLRTRYTFGYEPPESPDDGRLRRISLKVNSPAGRKKSDLVVLARSGYYFTRPDARKLQLSSGVTAPNVPLDNAEPAPPIAVIKQPDAEMPILNRLSRATLTSSTACRSQENPKPEDQQAALYLAPQTRQPGSIPDLVFRGTCGSPDYFVAAVASDDLSMIADLGDVPVEDVTAHSALNSQFVRSAKVDFNHTYAVLLNRDNLRGLFIFRVIGYLPNERADLVFAVKHYQSLNPAGTSAGFDWMRRNEPAPSRP
ncbi:MAG: VWA domain-containing protein [Blastocatellales bacterium]